MNKKCFCLGLRAQYFTAPAGSREMSSELRAVQYGTAAQQKAAAAVKRAAVLCFILYTLFCRDDHRNRVKTEFHRYTIHFMEGVKLQFLTQYNLSLVKNNADITSYA